MRYLLLILICSAAWAADPVPEAKLPADVQRVVDARDAEVAKAKAVYDAAVAKATAAAVKQVEAVVKAKTQRGDLEGALAGKSVVDKWNGGEGGLLGEVGAEQRTKKITTWIIGRWKVSGSAPASGGVWDFTKNGEVNTGGPVGKYTINDDVITITWPSGRTETVKVAANYAYETTGIASNGAALSLTKLK